MNREMVDRCNSYADKLFEAKPHDLCDAASCLFFEANKPDGDFTMTTLLSVLYTKRLHATTQGDEYKREYWHGVIELVRVKQKEKSIKRQFKQFLEQHSCDKSQEGEQA